MIDIISLVIDITFICFFMCIKFTAKNKINCTKLIKLKFDNIILTMIISTEEIIAKP